MIPDIVVDIGNSRIKWGRCTADAVTDRVSLPHGDPTVWQRQLEEWNLAGKLSWAMAGVQPGVRDQLAEWACRRGDAVRVLDSAKQLPLRILLEHPEKVGIDRLLNAVAVNSRRRHDSPAIIVDAGSAVTVDYLDENGAFRGGAIFPGIRLMAQALHDHTALLPLVDVTRPVAALGTSTKAAIESGLYHAALGGIVALIDSLRPPASPGLDVFFGGGDTLLLAPQLIWRTHIWHEMTLDGVRLSVLSLPE